MADTKDVFVITEKQIKDFVSSCGIACVICKSTISLMRGRAFQICDDCLKDLREIIKEKRGKMTLQLHHLHTDGPKPLYKKITEDEIERMTARIAELERMDTEHTLQIAKMNDYIHHLEEERRWRMFSEEKPEHHQWILVFSPNHSQFTTGVELRRWDDGCKYDVEVQEIYEKWMPRPMPPEEEPKER